MAHLRSGKPTRRHVIIIALIGLTLAVVAESLVLLFLVQSTNTTAAAIFPSKIDCSLSVPANGKGTCAVTVKATFAGGSPVSVVGATVDGQNFTSYSEPPPLILTGSFPLSLTSGKSTTFDLVGVNMPAEGQVSVEIVFSNLQVLSATVTV